MAELLRLNLIVSKIVEKGDTLTVMGYGRTWSTICDQDGKIETVFIHGDLMFPNYMS